MQLDVKQEVTYTLTMNADELRNLQNIINSYRMLTFGPGTTRRYPCMKLVDELMKYGV